MSQRLVATMQYHEKPYRLLRWVPYLKHLHRCTVMTLSLDLDPDTDVVKALADLEAISPQFHMTEWHIVDADEQGEGEDSTFREGRDG